MPALSNNRLLKSKLARTLQQKTNNLAQQCQQIIADKKDLENAKEELRALFNSNLDEGGSLVIVNSEGLALVHVNKLREGMFLNDPAGLKAAQAEQLLVQVFEQNTGQLMLDAAVPLKINNQKIATLRIGKVITPGRLIYRLLAFTLLPVLVYIVTDVLFAQRITPAVKMIIPAAAAVFSSVLLSRTIQSILKDVKLASKTIAAGDLSVRLKPKANNDLGIIIYEINKISLGLKAILQELEQVVSSIAGASQDQVLAAQELSKAVNEVASSVESIASGSANQAHNIGQVEQFTIMLSKSLNAMVNNTQNSVQLASSAQESGENGTRAVNETINQMQTIHLSVEQSSHALKELEISSQEIGDIVNTITDIAEQTNLLALNAAIEAARAGEQGRGFAVVAEEVRKLAEQSNVSAQNIMSIISKTQDNTGQAADSMRQALTQVESGLQVINGLNKSNQETIVLIQQIVQGIEANNKMVQQIENQIQNLKGDITAITSAANEAAEASQSVAAVVEEQNAMSQEIAAGTEQTGKAIEKLSAIVARFKLE